MANIKRVKKSITEKEFKCLMAFTRGDESLKDFNRVKMLRIFTLLYFTGMRINELSQIQVKNIKEILEKKETIIISHKTKTERILYFSDNAIKNIQKYFNVSGEDSDYVICSWGNPQNKMYPISLIQTVNKYMKIILGQGFSSHSFRQGILTEMASRGTNTKIMQNFIGHSNPATTLRYVKPTKEDIQLALPR